MPEPFAAVLAEGGRSNSLGSSGEVVAAVLRDPARLDELYACLFEDDAWLRMRAADALEKVCRARPALVRPLVPRLLDEVAGIDQASVQWHLAQILGQVELTDAEARRAADVLRERVSTVDVDWIVAANAMKTLVMLADRGALSASDLDAVLRVQLRHRSPAVVRLASRLQKPSAPPPQV